MTYMSTLIERMEKSFHGEEDLGERQLRLIKASAGKIANAMVADGRMDRIRAHEIWKHVVESARTKGIEIPMPAIPDVSMLTPDVLTSSMPFRDDWRELVGSGADKSKGAARWL